MRYIAIICLVLVGGEAGLGQTITNTLKNFSREGTTYTFEMWSQASQSGMGTNQALFQVNITYGAFTVSGSTITLESKFSSLGPGALALWTSGGAQRFQFSYGGSSLPSVEISSAAGGEKVLTVRCKIIDTTKTSGLSWVTANGWYWLSNLWAGSDNSPLPVQLSSFAALPVNGSVRVAWTTTSEIDNYGFWVQRGTVPGDLVDAQDGFVPGHNTSLEPHEYSWVDSASAPYYRLRQIDLNGDVHYSEVVSTSTTGVAPVLAPREYSLAQNYPNPFNPSTTIRYGLPSRAHVTLTVFNTLGQLVSVLANDEQEAGYHEVRFDGSNLPSGVYFYRMEAGSYIETKKLLLIR